MKQISGTGALLSVIAAVVIIVILLLPKDDQSEYSFFEVQKGPFEILVTVTGELEAENSQVINGPSELQSRNIRLRSVPILDLIPEGAEVEKGDRIATLDRTEAELSLRDLEDQMLSEEAQYNATMLDTTITLSNLRDELINLEHAVEERKLILEQSSYEPPATIRQAEINLERAKLEFQQAVENYSLFELQAAETMREAAINLERSRRRFQALSDMMEKFIIRAPESGMVIYHREWNGQKRTVGSTINGRDLAVAVMPDLTSLVSRTFVNEIDVNKVFVGQPVRIGMDAFPERNYSGMVIEVSNVGQELPNTDAKVFEVLVTVDQVDGLLKPAMTTSNTIVTGSFDDVYYIPLSALHDQDGIPYVYKSDGTRQIVVPGPSNDNFIIIEKGLLEGDLVHLSVPGESDGYRFTGNELIADIH